MYRYRAFGLKVASDVRMDELASDPDTQSAPDLTIAMAPEKSGVPNVGEVAVHFVYDDPAGVKMVWPGVVSIRIVGPELVYVEPHPEVPDNLLPFQLLGPVMGWILHLRKFCVLHGSAVAFKGKSFGFLGDKMAGKSTTAAAFLRAGADLLTDDLLAIETPQTGGLVVQPAFAQLKLSEEAGASVQVPGARSLPLVLEGFPKKQFRLDSMHEEPTGCDALFVLQRGADEPRIEWMDGASAFKNLMRYSYFVRFSQAPIEMQDRARYFEQFAALTQRLKVATLHVPADLGRLHEVVDHVAQTLEASSP